MAPFFGWLDDLFNTASERRHSCSLLFTAVHLAYQAVVVAALTCLAAAPAQALAAYFLAYVLVPPRAAAALVNAIGLPEAARALTGRLCDAYRRDCLVTYAAPGQPGSFAPPTAERQDGGEPGAQPPCVFACHPTGEAAAAPVVCRRESVLPRTARGLSTHP